MASLLAWGTWAAPASADYLLDQARDQRQAVTKRLHGQRRRVSALSDRAHLVAALMRRPTRIFPDHPGFVVELERRMRELRRRVARHHREIGQLVKRREDVAAWIDVLLPFKVCPVRGATSIPDDFGVWHHLPPPHVHQGNDIAAAYGAPIVAPFDGRAVPVYSTMGGLGVNVYGSRGFVYNAHLSALGSTGSVRTGTVIGFVGTSGNATSSHDHFEWHPGNGPAVDPRGYLLRVC